MKIVLISSFYNNLIRKILSSKEIDIDGIGIAKSNSANEQMDLCERLVKVNPDLLSIKWDQWHVEHVFHFIKGTPLYDALPQYFIRSRTRLVVEGYNKNPSGITIFRPGQLIDFGTGYYLACLDGIITIKKQKFSVVKTLMTNLWHGQFV